MIPDLFGCRPEAGEFERLGDLPVIRLHRERLPAAGLLAKRALDVMAASSAVMVLAPLLALIAGLIRLDSPGLPSSIPRRAPDARADCFAAGSFEPW